jgi:hypothetical protein
MRILEASGPPNRSTASRAKVDSTLPDRDRITDGHAAILAPRGDHRGLRSGRVDHLAFAGAQRLVI